MVDAIVFDFGGVLAEEGFREGLEAIGRRNGLEPEEFFKIASELVYETGYVRGMADEATYWNAVRDRTGIQSTDQELREHLLKRFVLRPQMVEHVQTLRSNGFGLAILSDQTNWLDEVDERTPFFHWFDHIFNSFRLKKSKKDPSLFHDVCELMGLKPEGILFIDDSRANVERASAAGLKTIHFTNMTTFEHEMQQFL